MTALAQDDSYATLLSRHYATPEMREKLNPGQFMSMSATGRFNGTDLDRLTIFPVEGSLVKNEYFAGYAQMLIKSENGTTPDLIIDTQKDSDFPFTFGQGTIGDDIGISDLSYADGEEGRKHDGLKVSIHPEGSTIGIVYTYLLRDGKWEITPPRNPCYMTMQECADAWPESYYNLRVTGTWCKDLDGKPQINTVALFPMPATDEYLIKMNTSGDYDTMEVVDNVPDSIKGKPLRVSTYPDWWPSGEELLLVELQGGEADAILYRLAWNDPDAYYINGRLQCNGGLWSRVGTATRDANAPGGWQVTRTDAGQLEYLYPWWVEP